MEVSVLSQFLVRVYPNKNWLNTLASTVTYCGFRSKHIEDTEAFSSSFLNIASSSDLAIKTIGSSVTFSGRLLSTD